METRERVWDDVTYEISELEGQMALLRKRANPVNQKKVCVSKVCPGAA